MTAIYNLQTGKSLSQWQFPMVLLMLLKYLTVCFQGILTGRIVLNKVSASSTALALLEKGRCLSTHNCPAQVNKKRVLWILYIYKHSSPSYKLNLPGKQGFLNISTPIISFYFFLLSQWHENTNGHVVVIWFNSIEILMFSDRTGNHLYY